MIANAKSFSDLYLQIAAALVVSSKLGKLYQPPHLVNDFNVDGLDYPESKACQYAKGHWVLSKGYA